MEKRKRKKEISAHENYQLVEVSDATDDSLPLSALKNVDAKKTGAQDVDKTQRSSTCETSLKRKKKNPEKITHFMEMEYHGSWWTGVEHDDFRTKTFDLNQHHFMSDLEVFMDALTEDGHEFSFQYTKKTDPVYALEPTKKYPEGRRWTGITWINTKDRLDLPICPAHGKPFALMDSGASHVLLPLHMLKSPDLENAKKIQVNLAVGHREGRMFRDEVYADGK
eukprot:91500-Amphidinium_carterae.1